MTRVAGRIERRIAGELKCAWLSCKAPLSASSERKRKFQNARNGGAKKRPMPPSSHSKSFRLACGESLPFRANGRRCTTHAHDGAVSPHQKRTAQGRAVSVR